MEQISFNPLWELIRRRIQRNKNAIIVVNGPTGSGKSYGTLDAALKLSTLLDTKFDLKRNLDFSFTGLLKKMYLPGNDKKGTVFIFEEVGAVGGGGASREWFSQANAFFHSFMQTSRHRNQILLLNCPLFSYLDRGARELVHVQITMQGIDERNGKSFGKPFLLQTNTVSGKIYFKYLRFSYKGSKTALGRISFDLPNEQIRREYEAMKNSYTNSLNKRIMAQGEQAWKKADKGLIALCKNGGLTQEETALKLRISERTVQRYWNYTKNTPESASNKENPLGKARFGAKPAGKTAF